MKIAERPTAAIAANGHAVRILRGTGDRLPESDMRVALGKQRRRRCADITGAGCFRQLRSARGVVRVATVLSLFPDAVDPAVPPVVFREFAADDPLIPCVVFMFDEPVPVALVPRDVVARLLSPDCAEPLVPLVPLAALPDVPPLVPLAALPDIPPLVAPELVEPEPVEPEVAPVPVLPALPPVCACAIPINATAAIVASEVTILVDMLIS